jgi:hypothetical protein
MLLLTALAADKKRSSKETIMNIVFLFIAVGFSRRIKDVKERL